MDEVVFDRMTRVLSASTRRGLLTAVGTALLTALGSPASIDASRAKRHSHKHKHTQQARRKEHHRKHDHVLAQHHKKKKKHPTHRSPASSPPSPPSPSPSQSPPPLVVCTPACPAGQRCTGSNCVCDGVSCPTGCC